MKGKGTELESGRVNKAKRRQYSVWSGLKHELWKQMPGIRFSGHHLLAVWQ